MTFSLIVTLTLSVAKGRGPKHKWRSAPSVTLGVTPATR
jgi:hypothetical protein